MRLDYTIYNGPLNTANKLHHTEGIHKSSLHKAVKKSRARLAVAAAAQLIVDSLGLKREGLVPHVGDTGGSQRVIAQQLMPEVLSCVLCSGE